MSEALKRAVRTAVQTFLGVFAVALTGWLQSVADAVNGGSNVPTLSTVAMAAIAGFAAAAVGLISFLQNAAETTAWWPSWFRDTSQGRAVRTAVQTFVGVFIITLTGWVQSVGEWANDGGDGSFPSTSVLSKAAVSAFVAAAVGIVSYVQNYLEDGPGWLKGDPAAG